MARAPLGACSGGSQHDISALLGKKTGPIDPGKLCCAMLKALAICGDNGFKCGHGLWRRPLNSRSLQAVGRQA